MIRMKKLGASAALVGAIALTAGCGSSSSGGNTGGSASGDSGKKPLIGFSLRFIAGNPWLATLAKDAKTAGDKAGYTVDTVDARGDAVTQIQQMQSYINRGAKAIVIEPVSDQAVAGGIAAANAAGVPVIVVNDRVSDELAKTVACNIHDDAAKTAELVGAHTAEVADKKLPKGAPIKLYVQAIFPQELVTQTREDGFMKGWNEYFKAHPGRKITKLPNIYGQAQPDATLKAMRATLAANPDVNVIYNESDIVWGAIEQSLKESGMMSEDGKTKVIAASFDGDMDVIKQMANDPNFPVVAEALGEPRTQANYAIEEAVAAITGKKSGKCEGDPPTINLPATAVTTETAKEYVDNSSPYAYSKQP
jgi:ribose transport system substrate-binding protein